MAGEAPLLRLLLLPLDPALPPLPSPPLLTLARPRPEPGAASDPDPDPEVLTPDGLERRRSFSTSSSKSLPLAPPSLPSSMPWYDTRRLRVRCCSACPLPSLPLPPPSLPSSLAALSQGASLPLPSLAAEESEGETDRVRERDRDRRAGCACDRSNCPPSLDLRLFTGLAPACLCFCAMLPLPCSWDWLRLRPGLGLCLSTISPDFASRPKLPPLAPPLLLAAAFPCLRLVESAGALVKHAFFQCGFRQLPHCPHLGTPNLLADAEPPPIDLGPSLAPPSPCADLLPSVLPALCGAPLQPEAEARGTACLLLPPGPLFAFVTPPDPDVALELALAALGFGGADGEANAKVWATAMALGGRLPLLLPLLLSCVPFPREGLM